MANQRSLGVLEYRSIAAGMKAADDVLKAAKVDLIFAKPMCPGKYVMAIEGSVSATTAAMETGQSEKHEKYLVDSCFLGNPDPSIFDGLYLSSDVSQLDAVGILESISVASIFQVADDVAKTTPVSILEIRIAKGLSGKSYVLFQGEVSAVQASLDKAKKAIIKTGMLIETAVIPKPDKRLWESFL